MRRPLFSVPGIHRVSAGNSARRRKSGRSASMVEGLEIRQLLAAEVQLVRDMYPGDLPSSPHLLTDVNGIVFFVASDLNATELWKSDGSFEGTVLVKDIVPGGAESSPRELTNVNGSSVFQRAQF